jgi:hypothetical protein
MLDQPEEPVQPGHQDQRDHQEDLVLLELAAEQVISDPKVPQVLPEPRVQLATLDQQGRSDLQDHREIPDHPVLLDSRVIRVSKVLLDSQDNQVLLVELVRPVRQESKDRPVNKDHQDSPDQPAQLASLVTMVRPVPKVRPEPLAARDHVVRPEQLGQLVAPEILDQLVAPEPPVSRELVDWMEQLEARDPLDQSELWDLSARLDPQDKRVKLDRQVMQDLRGQRVRPVHLDLREIEAARESKDNQDPQGQQDRSVRLVHRVNRVLLEQLGLPEPLGPRVRPVRLVKLGIRVSRVPPDHRELPVSLELLVIREASERLVLPGLLVLLDHPELMERRDLVALRETRVNKDLLDLSAQSECRDRRVQPVQPESLVHLVPRVLLVHRDRPDSLEQRE